MAQALKSRQLLGYGIADAGQALIGTLIGFYQLYFFTDVMRLPLASVTGLFLMTKVLDSISYPVFGLLVDRMAGRSGKLRRWLGCLIVPAFLTSVMLFAFDRGWDTDTRIHYAYVVVSLSVLVTALISVVYSGLVSSIATLASDRARLSTMRFVCAFGASTAATLSIKYIVDFAGGKDSSGFYYVALVFAFLAALAMYVTYATTTERAGPAAAGGGTAPADMLAGVGSLFRNRIFLAPLLATLFTGIFVAIKSQTTLYYITYVMRRADIANFMLAAGTVSCAVGVALVGLLINRIDRPRLYLALMTGNALFIGVIYFLGEGNTALIIASHCANSVLGGACAPLMFSIYSDVVDYFDQSAGHRSPALINSLAMLGGRLGGSLGMVLAPLGLAYFHYQPEVAQSAASMHGLALMFTLVPAGFALLSAVAMLAYNITNQQAEATSRRLARVEEAA
jgi:GPH family glycoside/pentoside/hexuronide:cation symporter